MVTHSALYQEKFSTTLAFSFSDTLKKKKHIPISSAIAQRTNSDGKSIAKGKKTGGNNFKPGQSGNPAGRTPLPEDIKKARKLNQKELERSVNKFLYMTSEEIFEACKSDDATMFDKIIGSIITAAVDKSDHTRLEFILNRMIGKVQDKLQVTVPKPFIVKKSDGTQVVCGAEFEKEEDEGD